MNTVLPITHPQADAISIVAELHDPGSVEIAFFKNDEWVIDKMQDWEETPDAEFGECDTLVYRYVPVSSLQAFLKKYLA